MRQVKLVTVVSPVRHTVLEVISYPDLLLTMLKARSGQVFSILLVKPFFILSLGTF